MTTQANTPAAPIQDARQAIWRLFEEGYLDEDKATAGLLALDFGARRSRLATARRVDGLDTSARMSDCAA